MNARPTCAVCHKPVETFEEVEDTFIDRVVFVARCHGQTERVVLQSGEASRVDFGLAFATLALPPGPEESRCWCGKTAKWSVPPFDDRCCDACRARILRENPKRQGIVPIGQAPTP